MKMSFEMSSSIFNSVAQRGKEQSSQCLVRTREYDLLSFQNKTLGHTVLICIFKFFLHLSFVPNQVTLYHCLYLGRETNSETVCSWSFFAANSFYSFTAGESTPLSTWIYVLPSKACLVGKTHPLL